MRESPSAKFRKRANMVRIEHVRLDYGKYANKDLLENLSAVTVARGCLWSVR
jgi:hypothetical protein